MEISVLNEYFEKGLLYKQTHPTLPLTIWNYSEKVQYESLWDDVTVQCRGLITENTTGKILVRPFTKFFNYEEVVDKNVIPSKGDYVYVQEKMDGSLGILFSYDGEWIMATRGSFTSDQAIRGMEILKSQYTVFDRSFEPSVAYLCEIIYPENRIVVDYKKEKIVFLSAAINWSFRGWKASDEDELHWTTACAYFHMNGIKKSDIVKTEQHFSFSNDLYRSLKEKNEKNKEGFVLRFFPGNFRMKIKFEDYVRFHKIMTNLSTTAVWEVLLNGQNMDSILKDVPDEFYQKIREYEHKLHCEFLAMKSEYEDHFESIRRLGTRKLFAQFANTCFKHPKILFAMYDGKSVDEMIWKIIKPEFKKL
jgi:RNA ligase